MSTRYVLPKRLAPMTTVLLLTSALTLVVCQGMRATPFSRRSKSMPSDFRRQYEQILQVEKLKAELLRGLNLTTVPEPPRYKPPQPVNSILNRLPPVNDLRRGSSSALPDAIIWSEPVDTEPEEDRDDQLLFRVNSQQSKSPVINRVSLILRLRSRKNKKNKRKDAESTSNSVDVSEKDRSDGGDDGKQSHKGDETTATTEENEVDTKPKPLPDIIGKGYQNDATLSTTGMSFTEESEPKQEKKRKRKNSGKGGGGGGQGSQEKKKRKNKKWRRVKVLVQAQSEGSGKFRRVAVQRFTIRSRFNWIKLPIPASLVARAVQSSNQSLVLRIRCKRCKKGRIFIDSALSSKSRRRRKKERKLPEGEQEAEEQKLNPASLNLNPNRPYLVIRTAEEPLATDDDDDSPKRSERDVSGQCENSATSSTCCSQRVNISFRSLGWDSWIVYPASFSTVLCQGVCPLVSLTDVQALPSSHDPPRSLRLQSNSLWSLGRNAQGFPLRVNSGDGASRISAPSGLQFSQTCAPRGLRPLEVLKYTEQNSLVRVVIPNLISQSCGCVLS